MVLVAFHLDPDRPDEAQQFTSGRRSLLAKRLPLNGTLFVADFTSSITKRISAQTEFPGSPSQWNGGCPRHRRLERKGCSQTNRKVRWCLWEPGSWRDLAH